MPSPSTSRRGFLETAFAFLAAAVAAVVGVPVTVAFLDPSRRRTVAGGGGRCDLGRIADIPVGTPSRHEIVRARTDAWDRADAKPVGAVWLVRRDATRVDAYSAVCPHLGCPIDFHAGRRLFTCPCHESAFAQKDGRRLKGPAPRGLDPLPVEVKGGRVSVVYKQFIQGIPSRREA